MGLRFRRDRYVIEDDKPLGIGRFFCATEICIPKMGLTTDERDSIFRTIGLSGVMGEYNYKEELPC